MGVRQGRPQLHEKLMARACKRSSERKLKATLFHTVLLKEKSVFVQSHLFLSRIVPQGNSSTVVGCVFIAANKFLSKNKESSGQEARCCQLVS